MKCVRGFPLGAVRCRRGRAGGLGPTGRKSGFYSLRSEGTGRECQERAVMAARSRPTRGSGHSMPSMRLNRELPWPSAETAETASRPVQRGGGLLRSATGLGIFGEVHVHGSGQHVDSDSNYLALLAQIAPCQRRDRVLIGEGQKHLVSV